MVWWSIANYLRLIKFEEKIQVWFVIVFGLKSEECEKRQYHFSWGLPNTFTRFEICIWSLKFHEPPSLWDLGYFTWESGPQLVKLIKYVCDIFVSFCLFLKCSSFSFSFWYRVTIPHGPIYDGSKVDTTLCPLFSSKKWCQCLPPTLCN